MLKQMYKQSAKKQLRWDAGGRLDTVRYKGFTSYGTLGYPFTSVCFSVPHVESGALPGKL